MSQNNSPVNAFQIARGYLIRFVASYTQSNEQIQISFEQLKYISKRKEFQIVSKDSILRPFVKSARSKLNPIRIEFIRTEEYSSSLAFIVQSESANLNVIVVSFDEISRKFKFNSKLASSISDFFTKSSIRANDVYLKFCSDSSERFLILIVKADERLSQLELIISNESNLSSRIPLVFKNETTKIDRFDVVNILELNPQSDSGDYYSLLNIKIIFFLKVLL